MNYLIVLSGGTGNRMKLDIPKQYVKVNGKSILCHTLDKFDFSMFEKVVIVIKQDWIDYISDEIKNYNVNKVIYADAGDSRQESIFNGLKKIIDCSNDENDIVVIHDAARPNVSPELIKSLILGCNQVDGVMPVLPVKDTIYQSKNGLCISGLLSRDELFCGQSPEAFKLHKYFDINNRLRKEDLEKIRGSSEIAYKSGFHISLIEGDESNYKITTPNDLIKFTKEMEK